jgi:hypothetical protein
MAHGDENNLLATMRSPARSPQLAEVAARENLPIAISSTDVDSDESVTEGFKAIHRDHGLDLCHSGRSEEAALRWSLHGMPFVAAQPLPVS